MLLWEGSFENKMDPIKKLKLRLYYIYGESLVLLSLVSTLVLNLALSNLTTYNILGT